MILLLVAAATTLSPDPSVVPFDQSIWQAYRECAFKAARDYDHQEDKNVTDRSAEIIKQCRQPRLAALSDFIGKLTIAYPEVFQGAKLSDWEIAFEEKSDRMLRGAYVDY